MQKVSEELAAELKSLYQEKKFSELIYKINSNFGENAPAGILNLLGATKLLVAISDEEILSARQTFKDAYLKDKSLTLKKMGRGFTWLDTGTTDSLHEASSYIRSLEKRQGLKIGCPEEVAWRVGFINDEQLYSLSIDLTKSGYGQYLQTILNESKDSLGFQGIKI